MHPKEKRPTVEVVLTILHAGGKFDSDSYAVSGGLHGVGVSVVNALSSRLDVEIHRDGQACAPDLRAFAKPGPLRRASRPAGTGTTITFWADGGIFETTEYNVETVSRRLQEMAFLNKGLTITLRDERRKEAELVELADAAEPDAEGYVGEAVQAARADVPLPGRAGRLRQAPQPHQGPDPPVRSSGSRRRARRWRWRSRCSGTPPTTSRCTPSPTPSTPTRAAPTRRASGRR